jgi:peptide/nickel transport system ATP-binding protein
LDILTVRDLSVEFSLPGGKVRALRNGRLDIAQGQTVALVGESGSGKSVLCQAVMGILPRSARITGGKMIFRDPAHPEAPLDLAALDPASARFRALRGGRMSMIFQEPMTALSPMHTIGDQVGEAWALHEGGSKAQARAAVREMLHRVGFPDPAKALDTYPFELSGGMRQRAVIAMALICKPALLIADEPTTALDVTIQAQILKLVKDLQADLQMGVLFVTHDLGVVANIADEVVVMHHGEIMESGPCAELFENPQHPYLKALMGAVPRMGMGEGERLTPLRGVTSRIETWASGNAPAPSGDAGTPLIEARGITKRFRQRKVAGWLKVENNETDAVTGVSLTLTRGRCLGLVGESGSGKTTLAKIIARAFPADEGNVQFDDSGTAVDISTLEGAALARYRRKVQYVFQDPQASLDPRMTVFEIISEPMEIHGLCGAAERRTRVAALLRLVGLDPEAARRYPHAFSGGQRQRIGIARALALEPEVLILDEPVSALDVSVQAQILNLLKDLKAALGLTYLFVSHNLAVVDYIADEVAVMAAGRIVEQGPKSALFEAPAHPYTKALMAAIPVPDLTKKLDLARVLGGRVSDPAAWPSAFRLGPGEGPVMTEVGAGHMVGVAPPGADGHRGEGMTNEAEPNA